MSTHIISKIPQEGNDLLQAAPGYLTKSHRKAAPLFEHRKPSSDTTTDNRRCLACGGACIWVILHRDGGETVVRVCLVCGYEEVVEE